ncbi:MAG: squalene synthase HpnC [Defluviicoccus sp.]|nr:squalene synthase HpnC [Defluviicoccus sp.]MDE0386399.1 squalene synthase HpnC [Defluviicoccus sp.]
MADRAAADALETPSGKWSGDENFPVGSWLLPARLRPHVAAYYAIARTTDDIADDPELAPDEKLRRLDVFAAAVAGETAAGSVPATAARMRESLATTGLGPRHVLDVIAAFKQDATKRRYASWDELMGYCNLSAAPVGRYVLDLHGEDRATWAVSDPLCNALQVLNHLQDCRDDYRALDRVYLPEPWLAAAGIGADALDAERSGAGLRAVLDRMLDGVDGLMAQARLLPGAVRSRRLAMETAVIVRLAGRLAALLREGDPLARRVALTRRDFARAGLAGAIGGLVLRR